MQKKIMISSNYLPQSHMVQAIIIDISPEYYKLLSDGLSSGYRIERAWKLFSAGSMLQVVTEVKSRILSFVLELSNRIPDDIDKNSIKDKSKEIHTSELFNNTVFGDNTTIIVGNSNIQNIQNRINKNDFESLANELRKFSVSEDDINSLKTAIEQDFNSTDHLENKYGKNVRSWVATMLTKATESVWNVGLGAAGSLIANALNAYYGWF